MIQDKVHSVKTEQGKCSVFFALLGQSSPFILQEIGFLKNSTTYYLQKILDTLFYMWYDYIDFGLEGSEKNVKNSST